MNFRVNVNVKTNGKEEIDALEKQINALKNETIKINVAVDDNLSLKNIEKQLQQSINKSASSLSNVGTNLGKNYGKSFNKGIDQVVSHKTADTLNQVQSKVIGKGFKVSESFSKDVQKELENVIKDMTNGKGEISSIAINTKTGFNKKAVENIEQLSSATVKYTNEAGEAITKTLKWQQIGVNPNAEKGKEAIMGWAESASRYTKSIESATKESDVMVEKTSKINQIQKTLSEKSYDAKISSLDAKLKTYSKNNDGYENIKSSINKTKNAYEELNKAKEKYDTDSSVENANNLISANEKMISSLKKCNNEMTIFSSTSTKIPKEFNQIDATIAGNKTLTWLKNNSAAAKDYGEALTILAEKQKNATGHEELKEYTRQVNEIKSEATVLGKTGKSFREELMRGVKQVGQFALTYGALQRIPEVLGQMAHEVLDVDTAMTELRKVSDASDNQLSDYFEHASESAKKYGAEIDDVISSAADWKRLGYSLDESGKLADATTLIQRVGDNMTQESSASGLISTLRGFGKDADEALSIIDKVNEVANTQPIDTAGLFAGLERSASSMSAANNTLEQTISLITAANSVVQDPDRIGNAFKTISMRIRGATTEMEEAGLDTEGMAESTAKLREEIMALSGVDIMIDADNFKSTYDILDELSMKWEGLTDIQQASITELMAGKHQGNVMSALMQNFDIARETLDTAVNKSDGSAEKELSNYQKSMQYSIDTFKAQFQELSNTTFESDWLKGAIDAGTGLLEVLTQIVDVSGTIPLLLGGIGTTAFVKNLDEPINHRVSAYKFPILTQRV